MSSYTDKFQDYARDIPLEIGHTFFPPANVVLPVIPLIEPRIPNYSFDVERRAKVEYEEREARRQREVEERRERERERERKKAEEQQWAQGVLTPSKIDVSSTSTSPAPASAAASDPSTNSFEEFESRDALDLLEWKSIDDRAALSQVLSSAHSSATQMSDPEPPISQVLITADAVAFHRTTPPIPPRPFTTGTGTTPPPLYTTTSQTPPPVAPPTSVSQLSYPNPNPVSASSHQRATPPLPAAAAPYAALRTKLVTKGYREHLVEVCLARLPKERMTHVEYYIKALSMLEKKGVPPTDSIGFFVQQAITDKQVVLGTAQLVEQLLGMGFDHPRVLSAVREKGCDRVAALDHLLAG